MQTVEHAGHNTGTVTTAGQTTFYPMGDALVASNTTETNRNITLRKIGQASMLFIKVQASSTTTASTFTFRKNLADTAMTISMAATATGVFSDQVNTATYNSGSSDAMGFKHITAAVGTQTLHAYGLVVTDLNNWRFLYNTSGTNTFSSANSTNYHMIGGRNGTSASVAEATAQATMRIAGSIDSMFVLVATNTRTAAITVTSRKNTAAGALTVSLTALTTGRFEDLAHADTIAVGDLYCLQTVTGADTGLSANIEQMAVISKTTDGTYMPTCPAIGGVVVTTASTNLFAKLQGALTSATAGSAWDTAGESAHQIPVFSQVQISKLGIRLSVNARPTMTLTLRQNSVSTGVAASITASTTGLFEDASNTALVSPGDLMGVMLSTNTGTNSATFQVMQSLWTDLSKATVPVVAQRAAMIRASTR